MNINKAKIFAWFTVIAVPSMMGILISMFFVPFRVNEVEDMDLYRSSLFSKIIDIVIVKQPFDVITQEHHGSLPIVYAGEPIPIKYEYIKYQDIKTKYGRKLVCTDGHFYRYEDLDFHPPGYFINSDSVIAKNTILPADTPGGLKCRIVFPTSFYVNELKPIQTQQETEYFLTRSKR